MNFKQITVKIFKANFRRYLLFFLCSSFTIIVFFMFMTLITNTEFMNPFKNSNSSNIIAPTIVVGVFSVFFTIYAQSSFIKFRKNEFGTFMVLGMTAGNIRWIMFIENSLIALFSLMAGLSTGTLLSGPFYLLVVKITDIREIPFSISFLSYLYTIVFFLLLYLLIIIGSFIASLRYEIIKLIRSSRREDKNWFNNPFWIIVGIVLIALGLIDMARNYDAAHSAIILRSMILSYVGLYLFISNIVWLISKIMNFFHKKLDDSILLIADLKYSLGSSKKVLFLITLLTSITMFFCNLSGVLLNNSLNDALKRNPYDIAFYELYGFNKISDTVLNKIVSKSETPLVLSKTLDIISLNNLSILVSDKNINTELGTDIHVEKGKYILLFQIVKDDGYFHDTTVVPGITIPLTNGSIELKLQKAETRMLFNNMGERFYILNETDFANVKHNNELIPKGSIKLLNFKDWYKTSSVHKELQDQLTGYNKENIKGYSNWAINFMSKPLSKIGDYLDNKHGNSYLLFLIGFVSVLFFICSAVILHFQLQSIYESEKLKYKKLYKIGITSGEISRLVSKGLITLFFTPLILSTLLSSFYSYIIYPTKIQKETSIAYSIVIGFIYIFFQLILYIFYKIPYTKRLMNMSHL